MWPTQRLAHLRMCVFGKFGSRSIRKLLARFGNAESALEASHSELMQAGITEKAATDFIHHRQTFNENAFILNLDKHHISIVFPSDPHYPHLLLNGSDRPELLFVRGNLPTAPMVSLVGSRKMTEYGEFCTDRLSQDLVQASIAIVSGLALGIDGRAHQACLEARGTTVAVLATGLDTPSLYPQAHVRLAERILEQGGCLISEVPPGTGPRKERFPMRNRIIASMSLATVVIEAAEKSGSLITAQYALEEGREVLAVPGPIWQSQSLGSNRLIQAGAKACLSAEDILQAIELDRPALVKAARSQLPLDPHEREVLDGLSEPKSLDQLVDLLDLTTNRLQACLSLLEIKGYIKPINGQQWIRI